MIQHLPAGRANDFEDGGIFSMTPEEAMEQARREANNNMGPAQTQTWDSPVRDAYEAERARIERERQSKTS
jgi:hypothetical protein